MDKNKWWHESWTDEAAVVGLIILGILAMIYMQGEALGVAIGGIIGGLVKSITGKKNGGTVLQNLHKPTH